MCRPQVRGAGLSCRATGSRSGYKQAGLTNTLKCLSLPRRGRWQSASVQPRRGASDANKAGKAALMCAALHEHVLVPCDPLTSHVLTRTSSPRHTLQLVIISSHFVSHSSHFLCLRRCLSTPDHVLRL